MTYLENKLGVRRLTAIICIAALTLSVGATFLGVRALVKQGHDEHNGCVIQSRGLEATRQLVPALEGINTIVQPPDPRSPLAKGLPAAAPIPAYYRHALKQVRYHLPRWLALEHEQPSSRHC